MGRDNFVEELVRIVLSCKLKIFIPFTDSGCTCYFCNENVGEDFSDENLKEYDEFVKILIKEMLEEDKFYFVMSDRNVRKLAQIMNASPNARM